MLFDGAVSDCFFEDFCMFFWEVFWSADMHGDTIDVMCFFIDFVGCFDFESFGGQVVVL